MLPAMVAISDEDIIAIQAAYHESGELSAAAEVRKRFRAIEGERAREWVRMICAWKPVEVQPKPATR
jgi:hypothetical protein